MIENHTALNVMKEASTRLSLIYSSFYNPNEHIFLSDE